MRDLPDGLVELLPFIRDLHNAHLSLTNVRPTLLYVPLEHLEVFKAVHDVYGMSVRFGTSWEVL